MGCEMRTLLEHYILFQTRLLKLASGQLALFSENISRTKGLKAYDAYLKKNYIMDENDPLSK